MDISTLKTSFILQRDNDSVDANVLRDYARKLYIQNEITASTYRRLIQELEATGATVPEITGEKVTN
ncbi:hypothetical protein AM500_10400 [Bacillus sp. FJAT-18017]|uniref:YppF family protein n=1 Tax=unclassified Bacillus (in: firmicutes) TaxID=185979 RepID=UPI0005C645C5|nr:MULTISPECIES: YppF family protein [unclassified Bacillus (in: firmicutes)]ALC90150.1 hypothetical protein AM500_10400 [Bacillus sp. FJAT-18017]